MYHSISDSPESGHPYYRTSTTPAAFARQMQFLHESGYATVRPHEVATRTATPGPFPAKLVAITFDDGYRDFYRHAFPILNRHGFSATVYLPTAYIGDTAREYQGYACLTWSEIRELHRAGVEFGSHTVSHPQLAFLNADEVRHEVAFSKTTIEDRLGSPVGSFSYPYAFPEAKRTFTARLSEILREAGYDNGVSTSIGTVDPGGDRLFMKRLPINSCDDAALFRAKIDGAYDWLHTIQYASKLFRGSMEAPRSSKSRRLVGEQDVPREATSGKARQSG